MFLEKFTEVQIVANAFVMFAAGFETVASVLALILYELSLKKHIQDRVREEINRKKAEYNGQITYDFLNELHYLDMVIAGVWLNNLISISVLIVGSKHLLKLTWINKLLVSFPVVSIHVLCVVPTFRSHCKFYIIICSWMWIFPKNKLIVLNIFHS